MVILKKILLVGGVFLLFCNYSIAKETNELSSNNLPYYPLKEKRIIVATGEGDVLTSKHTFEYHTNSLPTMRVEGSDDVKIEWVKLPGECFEERGGMIRIGSGKDISYGQHNLSIIKYIIKKPWCLDELAGVLSWDGVVFCIYFGDAENYYHPQCMVDSELDCIDGECRLRVNQRLSGTGAFCSSAIFRLSPDSGPSLIEISEGGRDYSKKDE